MSDPITLQFESRLRAPAAAVWEWITSVDGISAEMRPLMRMTVPRRIKNLTDIEFRPGHRLFRSYILLFGILPIDYSDLTLLELTSGRGFIEQSPMGSMRLWRHERQLTPAEAPDAVVVLTDRLTFQPRFAPGLVAWFVTVFFRHRHSVLRKHLGGEKAGDR
jgi:ligand-binding SRPBCC domain-containing protein